MIINVYYDDYDERKNKFYLFITSVCGGSEFGVLNKE